MALKPKIIKMWASNFQDFVGLWKLLRDVTAQPKLMTSFPLNGAPEVE